MTSDKRNELARAKPPELAPAKPTVKTERPDSRVASRDPAPGSKDRPGFDLGGAIQDKPDERQLPERRDKPQR